MKETSAKELLFGIAILIVILAIVVFVGLQLYTAVEDFFSGASDKLVSAMVIGFLAVFGSVVTIVLGRYFEKKKEIYENRSYCI